MPIVQISRIQHRRGKRTDLPQLAAGELGWVIDEQRLFIGNGTVSDGAPAVGNTEIVTSGSSAFTTALTHTYKGYLGDATPISTTVSRTLQDRLDEYVSVKDFGAKGDNSTADVTAIQSAIDEIYTDTDKSDTRSRRILFFPAGTYRINAALKIPPHAHLVGEGPNKTIIRNSGNNAVMVTQDNANNVGVGITALVNQIQISNITLKNTVAYGGVSLDSASEVYFNQCRFEGSYAAGGADASTSKGVTVTSTNALQSSKIVFSQCQFTKFARLVDISFDVTNVKFNNCDFNTAYYGALFGDEWDGSTTNGMAVGPRDIQFTNSSWDTINQQAIWVKPAQSVEGTKCRNVISNANWYGKNIANNNEGIGSIREVAVVQFNNDECTSILDFFERSDLRRADGSSELNAAPEIQGIGIQDKAIKSQTLADNTSAATTINEYPALAGKGLRIKYKIVRGTLDRTGEMVISASTNGVSYDDTFTESGTDVGVELTAVLDDKDSTSGSETVALKFTTTNTSTDATLDYQTTIIA